MSIINNFKNKLESKDGSSYAFAKIEHHPITEIHSGSITTISGARGCGKSVRLLYLAKEHNAGVVCENPELMRKKAYSLGLTGIDFYSYEELYDGNAPTDSVHGKPLYIDSVEDYFQTIYGNNIKGITVLGR